jgi:hypothetical protein
MSLNDIWDIIKIRNSRIILIKEEENQKKSGPLTE